MNAQQRFLETIRGLAQSGTTLVLVTHHVEEIIPEVDHIIILDAGRVLADGSKQRVLTPENLSLAYGAKITLHRRGNSFSAHVDIADGHDKTIPL
jgi:iron complex transport system ATP-binding protein